MCLLHLRVVRLHLYRFITGSTVDDIEFNWRPDAKWIV
jgi:hypothetical protein